MLNMGMGGRVACGFCVQCDLKFAFILDASRIAFVYSSGRFCVASGDAARTDLRRGSNA